MDEQQKKWVTALAWGVVAVIFILRLNSSSCSSNSKQQNETETQLVEESKVDRQAREQNEEADRQAREAAEFNERKKTMREKGHKAGYEAGFTVGPASYTMDDPRRSARTYYTAAWGAPTTPKEKELFEIFVEEYVKAYEEGHNNQ